MYCNLGHFIIKHQHLEEIIMLIQSELKEELASLRAKTDLLRGYL